MKLKYIKPDIKVRKIEAEEDILDFASQENGTQSESLDGNSDDPINNSDGILVKFNVWDTDNEE